MSAQTERLSQKISPAMQRIIMGLCGIVAVLVALKVTAYSGHAESFTNQNVLMRMVAFAALTVWTTFTLGIGRRGTAAILVLAFASVVELFIMPARTGIEGTLVAANLGIVLAYCGFQIYWYAIEKPRRMAPKVVEPA